ncbi:hypothetical protein CLAFUW4_08577 [Fulvia fulva]|uniref:Uncharacterized protein n=1 Tax=Passalora fulva TaxID=5499 RepID=A0A9Q8P6M4_PASFU|nr:uncharacterized protein CLAFUR5_08679 [Fulvia fulva]KAK4629536.1 hypothetical protein CLAFUR4_08580 [Fulvia fulva]KAK4630050.1 hypothetical protein CLAFUR0_08575 [Fulvia fulva]UJO14987.1 hypothetical protein CLAFUR5_08679 [Fulvia fulva]WPV12969.1 hypothetical protein CLAFUW4_08577 [Fulvia fulva]WPV27951.1 hypothetical protein CLAFUW7_08575 [Fulvia fulva]
MGNIPSNSASHQLRPSERAELLDVISKLHADGTDDELGFPHILVYQRQAEDSSYDLNVLDVLGDLPFSVSKVTTTDRAAEDKNKPSKEVLRRLNDPRAIVLVVLSAASEPEDDEIFNLVSNAPEIEARTLGVMTEAEVLPNSKLQQCWETLQEENLVPGLG